MRAQARPLIPQRPPGVAVLLSFVWPGLGHWYLNRPRAAAILGIPALIVAFPGLLLAARGLDILAAALLAPTSAILFVAVIVFTVFVRLFAIADSFRLSPTPRPAWLRWASVGLAAIVLIVGSFAALTGVSLYSATTRVFQPGLAGTPPPTLGAIVPSASTDLGSLPTPNESQATAKSRITFLLVGSDSGMGYNHSLTDTILAVSIDTATKSVVMVSVPRDTSRFPLPNGGTYLDKINSLATFADQHKDRYPQGGLAALADAVGYYIGVPVNYIAYVNLAGFKELIDTVGGVDVTVERTIDDPVYQFPDGQIGFHITAGPHHLDGRTALAYARSRYGLGDSDFTRARRQQQILLALRAKLTSPAVLPNLPRVINSVADVIATNFPAERIGDLVTLSHEIANTGIKQFVLGPPYAHSTMSTGVYLLIPDRGAIATWSRQTFGADSRYSTGRSSAPSASPSS